MKEDTNRVELTDATDRRGISIDRQWTNGEKHRRISINLSINAVYAVCATALALVWLYGASSLRALIENLVRS